MESKFFKAFCPFEIGDQIKTRHIMVGKNGLMKGEEQLQTITDIACVHYLRNEKVAFFYELDGSGKFTELIDEDA